MTRGAGKPATAPLGKNRELAQIERILKMCFYAETKNIGRNNWLISCRFAGIDEAIINYYFYPYTKKEAQIEALNQFKKYLAENREQVAKFIDERKKREINNKQPKQGKK